MTLIRTNYKRPETSSGDMRTPVFFYRQTPNDGPEPGEDSTEELYHCYAQVYAPSIKDREILKVNDTSLSVTIKIRDSRGQYVADNKDTVTIDDYRYKEKDGSTLVWNIIDVRPDFEDDKFVVMVLGVKKS